MGGRIMASTINSSTSNGIVITPDTSGEIELQANGVTKAKVTANGLQDANGNSLRGGSFRNLIINGDMKIDQRNAGSAVTSSGYTVDRFRVQNSTDGAFSVVQDTDVPSGQGFINSLKYTVTTADTSLTTTQNTAIVQEIEGVNTTHLELGTANAKTFTISFWVKSSLTGTFGGALRNQGNTRGYVYTYNVNSANTWEKKTITIAGDTSGTWNTSTGIGIAVVFALGCGPDLSDTANTWYGANKISATGAVELIGTLNATWQITGVQLEVGEGASDFEFLPYDVQLARCYRYCQVYTAESIGLILNAYYPTNSVWLKTTMRATPTLTNGSFPSGGGTAAISGTGASSNVIPIYNSAGSWGALGSVVLSFTGTLSAEL